MRHELIGRESKSRTNSFVPDARRSKGAQRADVKLFLAGIFHDKERRKGATKTMPGHDCRPGSPPFASSRSRAALDFPGDCQLLQLVGERSAERFRSCLRSRLRPGLAGQLAPDHLERAVNLVEAACHVPSFRHLPKRNRNSKRVIEPFDRMLGAANRDYPRVRISILAHHDSIELRFNDVEDKIRHVDRTRPIPNRRECPRAQAAADQRLVDLRTWNMRPARTGHRKTLLSDRVFGPCDPPRNSRQELRE